MPKQKSEESYCPRCKAVVSTGAGFCPSCAAAISHGGWRIDVSGADASEVEKVTTSLVRKLPAHHSAPNLGPVAASAQRDVLQLFVSHSSRDHNLVAALVDLLRSSLNLPVSAMRCTSLDGYRLPAGARTDDQLRAEIENARAFIGVISSHSMDSIYVVFELGARWGAKKHLIPVLAPGADSGLLRGPLAAINALRCDSSAQVHQLIGDLAKQLEIHVQPAASYQSKVDNIVAMTTAT